MRLLVLALLLLGIFFRFAHLDRKVYWYDEAFTALRASGYTEAEVVQQFADSAVVPVAALQHYQQPAPDRGLEATLFSLAQEDPQHPPLYYGVVHFWIRWFGSSVVALRALPALLSLLTLPCVYWLAQELFCHSGALPTVVPVWVAVALFAVSPFQVAYAQESRQYSLWGLLTIFSTAALLRALRRQTRGSWLLYALTLTLNFYTFLLSGLLAVTHGLYVLSRCKWRWTLLRHYGGIAYLTATLLGVGLFLPWLGVVIIGRRQVEDVTSWMSIEQSWEVLLLKWLRNLGRIFYDRGDTLLDYGIQAVLLGLIAYAYYYLYRQSTRSVGWLIGLLTLVPVLPLILADLTLGGLRSTFPRYCIPTVIGVQFALVHLFAAQLSHPDAALHRRWRSILAVMLSLGILAGVTSVAAPTWWTKTLNQENPIIAEVLNQAQHPLLLSDAETGDLLSLSHALSPSVQMLIRPRCETCSFATARSIDARLFPVPPGFSEVFLFHPRRSRAWQRSLEQRFSDPLVDYRLDPIVLNKDEVLWRIINK